MISPRTLRRWVSFAVWSVLTLALRAQLTWLPTTTPTTQNLWGACYGGGLFVVVGENGTILTSPDGATWIARASGTSAWLNGVTFANQLYVAVGSEGTIVTSPDGVSWTLRSQGGSRLNGIAYGNGRFLAVGEGGAFQISTNGIAWTAGNIGAARWLRGITYAENQFLVSGQDGALYTTTTGETFSNISFSPLAIEAISGDDGYYVAAGEPGMLFTSVDHQDWVPRRLNSGTGVGYLRGACNFNNTLVVVGSNGAIAFCASRQAQQFVVVINLPTTQFNAVAGGPNAAVCVGNGGAIRRSPAESAPPSFNEQPQIRPGISYVGIPLTLVGTASGSATMTYQWNFNGAPIAGATQYKLVLAQPTLAHSGTYSVVATNPRGVATSNSIPVTILPRPTSDAVDPGFISRAFSTASIATVQSDGRILTTGSYAPYNTPISSIVRLNPNGTPDIFFTSYTTGSQIRQVVIQPSGKIVLTNQFAVVRLNANGSPDSSFVTNFLTQSQILPIVPLSGGALLFLAPSGDHSSLIATKLTVDGLPDVSFPSYSIPFPHVASSFLLTTDASGRILVSLSYFNGDTATDLLRFLPDGRLDPTFAIHAYAGRFQTLQAFGNKPEYASLTEPFEVFRQQTTYAGRTNEDGSNDASFESIAVAGSRNSDTFNAVFLTDGSVITLQRAGSASPPSSAPTTAKHYDSSGVLSPGSVPYLDANGRSISNLQYLPNGQLLAIGSFTTLNGVPTSGIAKLNLSGEIFQTQLSNLSIRTRAGNADQKLIAGFVVGGTSGTTSVLARGIGPELANYGVGDTLGNPRIDLYQGTVVIAANDDWDAPLSASFSAVGAFPLTSGSKDSAIRSTLGPGVYSMQISGASSTTGIALAEIYDAGPPAIDATSPRFVNLSGRAFVGGGEDALIAGFVLKGNGVKRLLIRAVGPTLGTYGVGGVLATPELTVYRGSDIVATATSNSDGAKTAAAAVGAFALVPDSSDAALVIDVSTGVYSAQVRGKNGSTGVALVEIYEVP